MKPEDNDDAPSAAVLAFLGVGAGATVVTIFYLGRLEEFYRHMYHWVLHACGVTFM